MNDIWMERVLNLTRQPYSYFPNKQSRLLYSTKMSTSVPKNIQCYFPNMKPWGFFSSGITQIRHLIPFVYIVRQLLPPSLTSDRSLLYKLTKRASLLLLLLLDIFRTIRWYWARKSHKIPWLLTWDSRSNYVAWKRHHAIASNGS